MKLLVEVNDTIQTIVEESSVTGLPKQYFIEGIFMQADLKNRNGRIYPLPIVQREALRYLNECVATNKAMGELNHPESPSVNPERASHKIVELRQEGTNFYGKAKIMNTPMGQIVKALIDEGIKLGVSTRGLGTVKNKNGLNEVQSDFFLSTIDIVSDPSGPDCWVNNIMESKEYIIENGIIKEKQLELIQKEVKNLTKKQISEGKIAQMFEDFLKTLK